MAEDKVLWELARLVDLLSEEEQALRDSRAKKKEVGSIWEAAIFPPDFVTQKNQKEKKQASDLEGKEKKAARPRTADCKACKQGVSGPGQQRRCRSVKKRHVSQMIHSMTDSLVKASESLVANQRRVEETLLAFTERQELIYEYIDHLIAKLDGEEDQHPLRLGKLHENMFTRLDIMGPSVSQGFVPKVILMQYRKGGYAPQMISMKIPEQYRMEDPLSEQYSFLDMMRHSDPELQNYAPMEFTKEFWMRQTAREKDYVPEVIPMKMATEFNAPIFIPLNP